MLLDKILYHIYCWVLFRVKRHESYLRGIYYKDGQMYFVKDKDKDKDD